MSDTLSDQPHEVMASSIETYFPCNTLTIGAASGEARLAWALQRWITQIGASRPVHYCELISDMLY